MIKYPYLEKWMSDRGLTQVKFAKLLDMDRTALNKILNGSAKPKQETIEKILTTTGMPEEKAFSETVIH